MIGNIIIGSLIFAYATWALYRFVKKSKQGKCASCDEGKGCSTSDCNDHK